MMLWGLSVAMVLPLQVREIQRMTGAMIKLPEDPASQQEETIVEIFGNFMATQVRNNTSIWLGSGSGFNP